jgi:hypothetical protein
MGSLTLGTQGRAGAALITTERVGTARRLGSGKQDGKVYESRNQWSNPLKSITGFNLVDVGRIAAHVLVKTRTTPPVDELGRHGGHGKGLRRTHGDAAGEKLGTSPVKRSTVNVGTASESPSPSISSIGGGQARRQPTALRWGGVLVVVGGQESWPQGEGGQRVRSSGIGRSEGRR